MSLTPFIINISRTQSQLNETICCTFNIPAVGISATKASTCL